MDCRGWTGGQCHQHPAARVHPLDSEGAAPIARVETIAFASVGWTHGLTVGRSRESSSTKSIILNAKSTHRILQMLSRKWL